ncbi:serine carboxypeptidase-like 9 isoform X2 [Capsella rubella]|uniref:serine carboxypeptidase-like 9 isoform X2 n=1 Tax=Capsella rubella TaxID=81985 RepID=UPI000CD4F352|nr:serine carboxypeptidase-like 9 isoform X2 [Capsella rubella]
MKLTLKLLLLLLFVLSNHHHADSSSIVKFLPGFEGPLPFELETGYIGIGEEEEAQLFYYFIKSENNPEEDPLLLWLNGGPGCSSNTGLLLEIGPVALTSEVYNGSVPSLVSTTYSWTKVASIIFLDQPVGAGFSYSKTPLGKTSDTNEVKMIHEFLQKWLSKHPQYYSNPFYATGDSYAGMIIPAVVDEISKGNYICCNPPINLQGYVLGNPVTHIEMEINYRIPFAYGMSFISDELYESLKIFCKGNYFNVDPSNTKCLKLVEEFNKCTENINIHQILIPNCDHTNTEEISPDCFYYRYHLLERWSNKDSVRKALHIHKW